MPKKIVNSFRLKFRCWKMICHLSTSSGGRGPSFPLPPFYPVGKRMKTDRVSSEDLRLFGLNDELVNPLSIASVSLPLKRDPNQITNRNRIITGESGVNVI